MLLHAVDGLVAGRVDVRERRIDLELTGADRALVGVSVLRGGGRLHGAAEELRGALGLLNRLLAPDAGHGVRGGLPGTEERHRDLGELLRRAALHEQHRPRVVDAGEPAQALDGLVVDGLELLAAVADLEDGGARFPELEELGLGAFERGLRKRRRTCVEVHQSSHETNLA